MSCWLSLVATFSVGDFAVAFLEFLQAETKITRNVTPKDGVAIVERLERGNIPGEGLRASRGSSSDEVNASRIDRQAVDEFARTTQPQHNFAAGSAKLGNLSTTREKQKYQATGRAFGKDDPVAVKFLFMRCRDNRG